MNISPSECSSGCESGWTMYLDQHFNSTVQYSKTSDEDYQRKGTHVNEEEDDYDLSMVSDASSGPPQVDAYENSAEKNKKSKKKNKIKEQKGEEKNLYLDDTASSPLCNFSQDILGPASTHTSMEHVPGFSQAMPASHVQHFGFFKSSQKEKRASAKSGSLLGRTRQ
ncbi:Hypothetical predicted protein [Olea europaea subsp. europaea]|uniref:Uncharacterized protein n=1 Tax=Olea europaea subsp. europaea TaxID=158383 RepID=A0A8S0UHT2_OLEEU|nr:Hypothetical predicted protein [Olea europaea subsp. europaea]